LKGFPGFPIIHSPDITTRGYFLWFQQCYWAIDSIVADLQGWLCAAAVRDASLHLVVWWSWYFHWIVDMGPQGDPDNRRGPHQDYSFHVSQWRFQVFTRMKI